MMGASDPFAETAVDGLRLAVGQLLRRLRSQANISGLDLSQMGVRALMNQNNPMTTADLARVNVMKPQSIWFILAGLEQEALTHRQTHPTDGRQVLFVPTEKGIEERRQRCTAKPPRIVSAAARLEPAELHNLVAAVPLLRRIGEA
jgi:DNA-binding MarR family transcriptional regulator